MQTASILVDSKIELYARIKRSSKYYNQGLDTRNKPKIFKVEEVRCGSHPFRLNANNYGVSDLIFYVKDRFDQLIKL